MDMSARLNSRFWGRELIPERPEAASCSEHEPGLDHGVGSRVFDGIGCGGVLLVQDVQQVQTDEVLALGPESGAQSQIQSLPGLAGVRRTVAGLQVRVRSGPDIEVGEGADAACLKVAVVAQASGGFIK